MVQKPASSADGAPELGIHPTGSGCPGVRRSSGLVDQQHLPQAGTGTTAERRRVSQDLGTHLVGRESEGVEAQWLRRYLVVVSQILQAKNPSVIHGTIALKIREVISNAQLKMNVGFGSVFEYSGIKHQRRLEQGAW
jgi:hypothetical protein